MKRPSREGVLYNLLLGARCARTQANYTPPPSLSGRFILITQKLINFFERTYVRTYTYLTETGPRVHQLFTLLNCNNQIAN
jgi:hypothetical protein